MTVSMPFSSHNTPSPLSEARMIQALYFPELSAELINVYKADMPLMKFVGEQRVARMKDFNSWLKRFNPQPYYESYKDYSHATNVLTAKCRKLIS
jgi:hypothetical protein